MQLSAKNKEKNKRKTYGKIWVDDHTPFGKRVSGAGVMFAGHYEKVKKNNE